MSTVAANIGVVRPPRPVFGPKERAILVDPLIANNPLTVQMLGICSALAITTRVDNALVMSVGVILVAMVASLAVSLIRDRTPTAIRIIVQLAIIASLVTVFDQVLKATFYEISLELSIFVGLIITNCMVLGRAEGFAMHHPPYPAILDALGNGLGFALILIAVSATRELLGAGKLLGYEILPLVQDGGWFEPNGLMLLPPSALFVIGLMIWAMRTWWPALKERD